MKTGACRFCGQIANLDTNIEDSEALDMMATERCECPQAKDKRKEDAQRAKICKWITKEFESGPLAANANLMQKAIEAVDEGTVESVSVKIGHITYDVKYKDKIGVVARKTTKHAEETAF